MQRKQRLLIACLSAAVLLTSGSVASAQDAKLFYRGDFDDRKVEAPNGAIINEDYRDFILGGGWDAAQTIKVRDGVHSIVGYSISNYTFIIQLHVH